jgi:hypothetical protein
MPSMTIMSLLAPSKSIIGIVRQPFQKPDQVKLHVIKNLTLSNVKNDLRHCSRYFAYGWSDTTTGLKFSHRLWTYAIS